jgi:hypothetical protein
MPAMKSYLCKIADISLFYKDTKHSLQRFINRSLLSTISKAKEEMENTFDEKFGKLQGKVWILNCSPTFLAKLSEFISISTYFFKT